MYVWSGVVVRPIRRPIKSCRVCTRKVLTAIFFQYFPKSCLLIVGNMFRKKSARFCYVFCKTIKETEKWKYCSRKSSTKNNVIITLPLSKKKNWEQSKLKIIDTNVVSTEGNNNLFFKAYWTGLRKRVMWVTNECANSSATSLHRWQGLWITIILVIH